jgi:hypothetical protein
MGNINSIEFASDCVESSSDRVSYSRQRLSKIDGNKLKFLIPVETSLGNPSTRLCGASKKRIFSGMKTGAHVMNGKLPTTTLLYFRIRVRNQRYRRTYDK